MSHRELERRTEIVTEHLSVVYGNDDSFFLLANKTLDVFRIHEAIFVLEPMARAINYNCFKELSRHKRGLVSQKEVSETGGTGFILKQLSVYDAAWLKLR